MFLNEGRGVYVPGVQTIIYAKDHHTIATIIGEHEQSRSELLQMISPVTSESDTSNSPV